MAATRIPGPPVAPGDLITGWSVALGEWAAAQITLRDEDSRSLGLLHLLWSGPEPATAADLADVEPLQSSFGRWREPAHFTVQGPLPRSARVIGSRPPLVDRPPTMIGGFWNLGQGLAYQRLRASTGAGSDEPPWVLRTTGAELAAGNVDDPRGAIRELRVAEADGLDCRVVAERFPRVQCLFLEAALGTISHARDLNRLHELRELLLTDVFGMTGEDVLRPADVPLLEVLAMSGIPKEYATATRALWRREVQRGTALEVLGARTPEWLAENRTNPLREWDTRGHISARAYRATLAELRRTVRAIAAAFATLPPNDVPAAMDRIGADFAVAVNVLTARTAFVETEEREDLVVALIAAVREYAGGEDGAALDALLRAVDAHRAW